MTAPSSPGRSLRGAKVLYVFLDTPRLAEKRALLERDLGLEVIENEHHPPHHQHGIVKYDAGEVILSLNHTSPRRFESAGWDGIVLGFSGIDPAELDGAPLHRFELEPDGLLHDADNHVYRFEEGGAARPDLRRLEILVAGIDEALAFYVGLLGLAPLEVGERTARVLTGNVELFLRQHHAAAGPRHPPGLLVVFHTPDIVASAGALLRDGVELRSGPRFEEIGGTARFVDPFGHHLCLYEPSPECLSWPSGVKVEEITARPARADAVGELPVSLA
jgi:predicted enzyme related to lactoylglutathione lyase